MTVAEQIGTDIDGYSVVAGHWPLVGPHSPVRTAYAAQALTALVTYLEHAVGAPDGLGDRQDADQVLDAVSDALSGLPGVVSSVERRRGALAE
ncbi:hypothetical protein GCM10009539_65580 [Cryptosporangium japonicum]|uniref:Uncharacterized protein n=1 Tax=Cryptosporangium japonicum TaxID=80872 RepID=A0ABN0V0J9_9ACTN